MHDLLPRAIVAQQAWVRIAALFVASSEADRRGRRKMLAAWILAGALAGGAAAPAADVRPTPVFRSYGVAEGLPSTLVYSVTQDHTGYIWIGTHAGLVRYDSRTFRVFHHEPGRPASLPANDVSALLVDRTGQLWVGGEGTGLNLYEPRDGSFRHWLHDPKQQGSLSANDVMAIAQDNAGTIWVGVYAGGLNRLDAGGKGFTHVRHHDGGPASIASDNVTALAPDIAGGLWIGTDAGLDRMDAKGRVRPVGRA
jgi:ligand-binding sensor domain-containing protein